MHPGGRERGVSHKVRDGTLFSEEIESTEGMNQAFDQNQLQCIERRDGIVDSSLVDKSLDDD